MSKICPLMSRPIIDTTGEWPTPILHDVRCMKENCALWHENACAITLIAANSNAMALNYT